MMSREIIKHLVKDRHAIKKQTPAYLQYYNLDCRKVEHRYEFFSSGKEEVFIQSFNPASPAAICFVLHGYLDHAGSVSNLINHLTSKGYQVIAYDLQGHGLSAGYRGAISTFKDYVEVFGEVLKRYTVKNTLPVYAIAHSTGGAILIDHLLRFGSFFEKAVLVSPLIRSYNWHLSKAGLLLLHRLIEKLPRFYKRNSSNRLYLQSVKKDPLQHRKIPVGWFKALLEWNAQLPEYPDSNQKIMVIQGDNDTTVDWKFNLEFIRSKFPNSEVRMVKGGKHQLLNERQELLKETFNLLDAYLDKKPGKFERGTNCCSLR
jgi:alpha-beta hydrolase superfamily lysophospholipase